MKIKRIMKRWLVTAAASTVLCLLVYASTQQVLSQTANDPQIQIAEDAANALSKGNDVSKLLSSKKVDISQSLSPFIIVYNSNGNPIASGGTLHGRIPAPPRGVFDHAKVNGENRLTWQPERGVRIASVIVSYNGNNPGFVLVGRSLRETEVRESQMLSFSGISLLIILVASFGLITGGEYFLAEKSLADN
jgi:hypothetical protein